MTPPLIPAGHRGFPAGRHSHEEAGQCLRIGTLGQVPAGQGLAVLPAPELFVHAGAVAGVPGRGGGLRAGRAAVPSSPRWTRPGHRWELATGQLGSWHCSSRWTVQGPASIASLGAPGRRGGQDGLHSRGRQELGHRTHSTPTEGPRSAPMERGLSHDKGLRLGSLHGPLFRPDVHSDVAGPRPAWATAGLSCHQRRAGESRQHQGASWGQHWAQEVRWVLLPGGPVWRAEDGRG